MKNETVITMMTETKNDFEEVIKLYEEDEIKDFGLKIFLKAQRYYIDSMLKELDKIYNR